jgi:hypothetical protein
MSVGGRWAWLRRRRRRSDRSRSPGRFGFGFGQVVGRSPDEGGIQQGCAEGVASARGPPQHGRLIEVETGIGIGGEAVLRRSAAGERGGAVVGRPSWVRMASTGSAAVTKARMRLSPPPPGQQDRFLSRRERYGARHRLRAPQPGARKWPAYRSDAASTEMMNGFDTRWWSARLSPVPSPILSTAGPHTRR